MRGQFFSSGILSSHYKAKSQQIWPRQNLYDVADAVQVKPDLRQPDLKFHLLHSSGRFCRGQCVLSLEIAVLLQWFRRPFLLALAPVSTIVAFLLNYPPERALRSAEEHQTGCRLIPEMEIQKAQVQ
jgi:hypothetical protein